MAKYSLKPTATGMMLVRGNSHYGEFSNYQLSNTEGFSDFIGTPEIVGEPDESEIATNISVVLKAGDSQSSFTVLKGFENKPVVPNLSDGQGVDLNSLDRVQLEAFVIDNDVVVTFSKETSDEDLRNLIESALLADNATPATLAAPSVEEDPLKVAEEAARADLLKAATDGASDGDKDANKDETDQPPTDSQVRESTPEEKLEDRRASVLGIGTISQQIADRRKGTFSTKKPLAYIIRRRLSGMNS